MIQSLDVFFLLAWTSYGSNRRGQAPWRLCDAHYGGVIMGAIASQITSLTIVYSTVYSEADQRKYQSSASLAFGRGIHRGPVNSPYKWPVTRKMYPFDDVIMYFRSFHAAYTCTWYNASRMNEYTESTAGTCLSYHSVPKYLYWNHWTNKSERFDYELIIMRSVTNCWSLLGRLDKCEASVKWNT